jgi:hypothetical protein
MCESKISILPGSLYHKARLECNVESVFLLCHCWAVLACCGSNPSSSV